MNPSNENNCNNNDFKQHLGTPNSGPNYSTHQVKLEPHDAQAPGQYYQSPYYDQNRVGYPDDINAYQNPNLQNSELQNYVYNGQHQLQNPGAQNFSNSQIHQNPEGQQHVHQNQVLNPNSISLYPDSGFPRRSDDEIPKASHFFTYNDDDVNSSGARQIFWRLSDSSDSELDSEDCNISRKDSQTSQKFEELLKVIESSTSEAPDVNRKKLHPSHFKDLDNKIQKYGESSKAQKSFISESGDSIVKFPDYIDTKKLGLDISAELKTHKISQTLFAEKIIGRTQGTLSDLLKKPKKWEHITMFGQSTYLKLWNWWQQPLEKRLEIFNKVEEENGTPKRRQSTATTAQTPKKARFVFDEQQKKTLDGIFKEQQKPSMAMVEGIAGHLNVEANRVNNWFSNARRRAYRAKQEDTD